MTDRPLGFGRRPEATAAGATVAAATPGLLDDETVVALLPDRPKRGHKGDFGKVLAIAGSLDYAGAALLVCRAAGRAGAGLVTLAVPESLQPLFAAKVVEATTMALPEDDLEEVEPEDALARILDHEHDAIVLGPGLRPGLATTELVQALLAVPEESAPAPIVLDAEALRSLASLDAWWERVHRPAVLTPHAGEFARLRAAGGIEAAGDGDLVGDVLAGVIGALLAQGLAPFDAARLGVYLHGQAAEAVSERIGDAGLLASDLPDALPLVRRRLAAIAERRKKGANVGFRSRDGGSDGGTP
jgi:NAD(P)H-hydrate epimerase